MGHGRSAMTGAVYRRRFGRACKCRLNVRPATINAASASGAVRPDTRRRIAPARAPANIATTDSTRRAVRPPATEESAASPVSVNVRTVVVRSGTASFRTTAFRTPMAIAVDRTIVYEIARGVRSKVEGDCVPEPTSGERLVSGHDLA
jgi:hypothetical protein